MAPNDSFLVSLGILWLRSQVHSEKYKCRVFTQDQFYMRSVKCELVLRGNNGLFLGQSEKSRSNLCANFCLMFGDLCRSWLSPEATKRVSTCWAPTRYLHALQNQRLSF